jgi:ribose 5-phosphate isomerase B
MYIASDHAGFALKKYLIKYLKNQLKKEVEDLGPENFDEKDDFPDYAIPLAKKVAENKKDLGILICGTGHGMCIAANKIKGIRAILGYSIEGAEMGRRHNDANVLCLAGKFLSEEHASAIVKKFLETEFDGDERLSRRIEKIATAERRGPAMAGKIEK